MAAIRLPPMSHYAKATLTVVGVLALLAAAWSVRNILILILVAAVLAIGLDPPVRRLERLRMPRGWAVLVIVLAVFGFLVLFSSLVVPPLVSQVRELTANIPDYIERLQNQSGFFGGLERKYHLSDRLQDLTSRLPSIASASFGTILGITKSIASLIFNTLTVGVLTVYFLLAVPRMRRFGDSLLTGRTRARDVQMFEESIDRIGGYVSGNIGISIIAGVSSYIFLRIAGVPFAAALALWVAIADLIPTVGAILGALVAGTVAAFSGLGTFIATIIFFVAYQQLENYVIAPRVMSRTVDLSPAAVLVSVLIGGSLGGLAGALLALPLAAAVKVILREVWLGDRLGATAKGTEAEPAGTS
jgi:predicted PurR-regulated permease PerM